MRTREIVDSYILGHPLCHSLSLACRMWHTCLVRLCLVLVLCLLNDGAMHTETGINTWFGGYLSLVGTKVCVALLKVVSRYCRAAQVEDTGHCSLARRQAHPEAEGVKVARSDPGQTWR